MGALPFSHRADKKLCVLNYNYPHVVSLLLSINSELVDTLLLGSDTVGV
jgi:hypothetical protein